VRVAPAPECECYAQANIAKEVNRLHGWSDKLWGRRYSAILVSDEEEAQIARLRYLIAQGCRENLVGSPRDWPGVSSTWALYDGTMRMDGKWVDRTAMYHAKQQGADVLERDFTTIETLVLSQIPAWRHLSREKYRDRIREMVHEIEWETRKRHRLEGTRPLGVKKIRMASPLDRAVHPKRSPAPDFHTATKEMRKRLRAAYRLFVDAFVAASQQFREGDRSARFPEGCFPPALGYLPYPRARYRGEPPLNSRQPATRWPPRSGRGSKCASRSACGPSRCSPVR
jgi:putative transposase